MCDVKNDPASRGIITKGVGGIYTVLTDDGREVNGSARGVFRHEKISPLIGDRVALGVTPGKDGDSYVIDEILPRKNCLVRPTVANLTHLFIVVPSAKPKPDLLTVDKMISVAEERGIEPVVVVNKSDISPEESNRIKSIYKSASLDCIALSAATGDGCEELSYYFAAHSKESTMIAALAGASAAGKSTLMKKLFPSLDLKTGEVSRKTERGRHTTRHVELFRVGERCFIADTPGFSLLDFTRFNFCSLEELPYTFREFREFLGKCKYTKCTHTKEEGCAVLEALSCGKITRERHESYVSLYSEIKAVPEWKRKTLSDGN